MSATATELRYPRVLLKISGEALAGERGLGFDFDTIGPDRRRDRATSCAWASLGLVIGGGNIVRGSQLSQDWAWTASAPTTWECSAR